MTLESPAFKTSTQIPSKYTCDGQDISPPLMISGVPVGAKSLALMVDDPDAPRGTWTHWTVWNMPASMAIIHEKTVPQGAVQGMTSFGKPGYGGPCPPYGIHRYRFKLFALDTMLDLKEDSDVKRLVVAMEGHTLALAELTGLYGRK